ncbi:LOW QUALITY PROTEIN: PGC-1 and ERR-induced regulator in muscle protein 1-like, partial [Pipistrellus kuhlii]|uniref:LOW QUALITY PROTEIN: PGC-1 and ERR-induced regulator in muscle protein 1-like n=1 Tax=Pipistrellus kuhlii TaxID=59472 RepID=UPI001E271BFD
LCQTSRESSLPSSPPTATTRQSPGPRSPRPRGWGSPDGPLSSRHTENRHPEEKVRGRPSPTPGRRKDKPASTRAGHLDRGSRCLGCASPEVGVWALGEGGTDPDSVRGSQGPQGLRGGGPGLGSGSQRPLEGASSGAERGVGVGGGKGPGDLGQAAHTGPLLCCFPRRLGPPSPAAQWQEDPAQKPSKDQRSEMLPGRPRGQARLPQTPQPLPSPQPSEPQPQPPQPQPRRHGLHRSRSPSARACAPLDELVPRLGTQVGGLQVVLDELRAPGGAFLPVPSSGPQPEAREPEAGHRAWLSWQLAHTGANLHWALTALDSLLAAQPGLPAPPPCPPRAPQP